MMRHRLRYGPLVFRDPLLLCGTLYVLLYFDASGFLRLGLLAAFLHEWGHIGVYLALFGQFPVIEVTFTGFCMRTRGREMTLWQTALLAAAGPLMEGLQIEPPKVGAFDKKGHSCFYIRICTSLSMVSHTASK